MTIVKPNKKIWDIKFIFLSLAIAALFLFGTGALLLYNQLINLRHESAKAASSLEKLEVMNAELKKKFYSLVDAKNLEAFAREHFLVVENNPRYLRANQQISKR